MDMSRTAAIKKNGSTDIAIIGISGRFPGASDVDEFWNNIANGKESITFFEKETMPVKGQNSAVHVNAGAVIDDIVHISVCFFQNNTSPASQRTAIIIRVILGFTAITDCKNRYTD